MVSFSMVMALASAALPMGELMKMQQLMKTNMMTLLRTTTLMIAVLSSMTATLGWVTTCLS